MILIMIGQKNEVELFGFFKEITKKDFPGRNRRMGHLPLDRHEF